MTAVPFPSRAGAVPRADARGRVAFTAGGAEHVLRFGIEAMIAYAAATGEAAIGAVRKLQAVETDPEGMLRVRNLFRAALQPAASAEEASAVIDELGVLPAIALLGEAVRAAFPQGPEAAAGEA